MITLVRFTAPVQTEKKRGGGEGAGGGFESVNNNNYDKTPKFQSKKQAYRSRSKPLKMHSEGKQACVGDGKL
jgi:hypothetical protein